MLLRALAFSFCLLYIFMSTTAANNSKGTSQNDTEEKARNFVRESNEEILIFLKTLKEGNSLPSIDKSKGVFLLISYTQMMMKISQIANEARSFRHAEIHDDQLKRDLEILSNAGLLSLTGDGLQEYVNIKLQSDELKKIICSYQNKTNCGLAYIPEVRERIEQSVNPNELQYYWEEWRNKYGPLAKDRLKLIVKLFLNASQINEKTILEFWYTSNYEGSQMSMYMEEVMKQIKPFYTEFHAYIRFSLRAKFGKSVVPSKGPIPHHLIERILVDSSSIIPEPSMGKKLPRLRKKIAGKILNAKGLVELADDFFKSMGFESLPESFWTSACNETIQKRKREHVCKNRVFDKTSDIGLQYCSETNFENYVQLHSNMARLYYAYQKKGLTYTQFQSHQFEIVLGKASILAATTPKHLKRIDILKNYTSYEEMYMNQIFQMGLKTMFTIPLHFIHNKIMSEALTGQVDVDNINKRYWELMKEYAGIKPPSPRSHSDLDFPPDFYKDIWNNDYTINFVNEILGYQFYHTLCNISGKYVEEIPHNVLKNCDFSDSNEVGQALRRMMSIGGKKPWKEVLRELIDDEPIINGKALLVFYNPLIDWLKAQNKFNKVKLGWTHPKRKISNSV